MNLLEYLGLAERVSFNPQLLCNPYQSLMQNNPTQPQVHHQRLQSKPWSSTGPEKRCRKKTCKLLPILAHHGSAPGSSSRAAFGTGDFYFEAGKQTLLDALGNLIMEHVVNVSF